MKAMPKLPSRAFTLIELLVVIGIIVLLASMLIPCLAKAKLKALQASCLCNQKQFGAAFNMYTGDNGAKLPHLTLGNNFSNVGGYWGVSSNFVTWINSASAMAAVRNDLMTNSLLFTYFPSVAVNHCPGDPRLNNPLGTTNILARGWAYDSYSFTDNISYPDVVQFVAKKYFIRVTEIRRVSECVIVSERVDSRGCNFGPFTSSAGGGYIANEISSLFGIYHGKVGTFSFADGHVEGHKWSDPNIIKSGLAANQPGVIAYLYGQNVTPYPAFTGLDASWIRQHWVNPSNP